MIGQGKPGIANRLGGQAALVFAGNVFTLLVGFPLQVFVALHLGAESLGAFGLMEGGVGLVGGLIAFGMAPTLVRFIPSHLARGEHACIRKLVAKGAIILAVAGSLAYAALLLALPFAGQWMPAAAGLRVELMVMGLLVPLSLFAFYLQQGLRGFEEIRYMVVGSSFMQLTVKAVLSVLLLTAGLQLMGYVWAVVVSTLFAVAWMASGLWRRLSAMPRPAQAQPCGAERAWRDYAKVMYGGSLLGMGAQYLDRFLLGVLAGASPVGVLMVVKQLQQMPVMFLQMFLAVAAPMFAAAQARGDTRERDHIYHLTTDWVVRLSAPLIIFLSIFAEPLLRLYGGEFAIEGKYALWILLAGQAINLGFGPLGNLMNMCGLEGLMLRLVAYQTLIVVTGIVGLVPAFGLVGAASAITAGLVFINLAALWLARRELGIRWWNRRFLGWLVPGLAAAASGVLASAYGPRIPGAAALVAYVSMVYAVFLAVTLAQGLHKDDRDLFQYMRNKLFPERGSGA